MRTDRLVALVLLLQARGRVTASDLAAELGVSIRTIYRDLDGLSAAGVPVFTESGPHGGCQLLDGYRFPLRALRPEEAEALLILGVPQALRELGLDNAITAAQRQIRVTAGLGEPGSCRPGDPQPSAALVHLDMPPWFRSQEEVPQLRILAQALREHRQLELRYPNGTAASLPPPRVVSPLGLVNKAGTWYLAAMTKGQRITVYRAGRISSARMLPQPADRPDGFELAAYWQQWSQEFAASRPRLQVTLRASPLALAIFPEVFGDQVRDAIDAALAPDEHGWRELTLSFEHEKAAAQRLAGFGAEIEVSTPAAVRDRLMATARGILSRYE